MRTVLILCLFLPFSLAAQKDSLLRLVESSQGRAQLKALDALFEVIKFSNPDLAYRVASDASDKSAALNDPLIKGHFIHLQAVAKSISGDFEKSDSLAEASLAIAEEFHGDELRIKCLLVLGNNANERKEQDQARRILQTCLEESTSPEIRAETFLHLGNACQGNDEEQALEHFIHAQLLYDSIGDVRGSIIARNNKSYTLRNVGLFAESLESLRESFALIELGREEDRPFLTLMTEERLGLTFGNIGQYQTAIEHMERAVALCQAMNNRKKEVTTANKLADYYLMVNKPEKALGWIEHVDSLIGVEKTQMPTLMLLRKAMALSSLGDYSGAIECGLRAYAQAEETGGNAGQLRIAVKMANICIDRSEYGKAAKWLSPFDSDSFAQAFPEEYAQLLLEKIRLAEVDRDFKLAFQLQQQYQQLMDQVLEENQQARYEASRIRASLFQWENRIRASRQKIKLLKAEQAADQERRNIIYVFTALSILLLGGGLYFRYRLVKKGKALLEAENDLLQTKATLAQRDLVDTRKVLEQKIAQMAEKIAEKHTLTEELLNEVDRLKQSDPVDATTLVEHLREFSRSNGSGERDWEAFSLYFEQLYPGFTDKLKSQHPKLTSSEVRFCCLLHIHLSTKEIANTLGISPMSANSARYRIRKKMGLAKDEKLEDTLANLSTNP